MNQFEGSIVGLAVGDALGRPTEFLRTLEGIRARFGLEGLTDLQADRHPAGTYTDDTQLSLCIARTLIQAGRKPLDELMLVMADEFLRWSQSAENDRAPGATCLAGCRNLGKGVAWREAGLVASKGCGSAMRTAPIGLFYFDDEARLMAMAQASSLPTHRHSTAVAAAVATALLVAWALRRDDPTVYPQRLAAAMDALEGGGEVARLVARVRRYLSEPPDEVLCSPVLGEAWVADEAVASGLYCFCRSPDDFQCTVLTAANTVGDSDSIGCIAGAISGAYNGMHAIPRRWSDGVENSAILRQVARDLLSARSQ
ncbi:MAG: ADP-ribosylglycohydrolase family protein [Planctomycetota bacterium]